MEDRLPLLPLLAAGRAVAADRAGIARPREGAAGQAAHAERRDPGQPERADHRKGGPYGYDGAKKVNGRKRHLLVDILGLLLAVHVSPANVSDQDGAAELLGRLDRRQLPRLRYGWADGGYRGAFLAWALARSKIAFQVVARADGGRRRRWLPPGVEPPMVPRFAVVPRRWVVERTFTWLGRFRRLSKDYEFLPVTSEAVIYLAMIQLLVRRLAGK
jgi:putative transposase